jgi:hypothetical protein
LRQTADDSDMLAFSLPFSLTKRVGNDTSRIGQVKDHDLLKSLRETGFKLIDTPIQPTILTLVFDRGGGFYIDSGCSSLIASRQIQHRYIPNGISHFTPTSLILSPSSTASSDPSSSSPAEDIQADIVIFATGYSNCSVRTRQIFGDEVADKVGDVWGVDDEGEVKGVWRRTRQEGFWVAAGGFWISRYYSKVLAVQIAMDLMEREGRV